MTKPDKPRRLLSAKALMMLRRERTLAAGGTKLGGVEKTARGHRPRAITLAPIRCLMRETDGGD
jgi:hypothetical protein